MPQCVPSIYVQTSSRLDAEELAWSLLADDVRLVRADGEQWAVRVVAPDASEAAEQVVRCVRRLRLGPVELGD